MILGKVFSPKSTIVSLESEDKDELFEELAQSIFSQHPEIDREDALSALRSREEKMSTGIMRGIAVPHGICASVSGCVGAIGISRSGIDYDSLDGSPVRLVFMLLRGPDGNELHLEVLKMLARILQDAAFTEELLQRKTPEEVFDFLCGAEN